MDHSFQPPLLKRDFTDLNPIETEIMSIGDVTDYLRISRTTLAKLRREDADFPKAFTPVKGKQLFRRSDLRAWVDLQIERARQDEAQTGRRNK